jgi:hypothetical protein
MFTRMTDRIVVLRIFPNESDATLARDILDSNGIGSIVSSADGASGLETQLFRRWRLSVRDEDVPLATELLDSPDEP